MAPTLVREPFHRDGWVYEEKIDGWRMLASYPALFPSSPPRLLRYQAERSH